MAQRERPPLWLTNPDKIPPSLQGQPIPIPPTPMPVQRSEEAARAAQYVYDLEARVGQMAEHITSLKGLLEASEEKNHYQASEIIRLKSDWADDVAKLKGERDYFHDRWITVKAKLTIMGKVILDVMKEDPPTEQEHIRSEELLRAIEEGDK